MNICDVTIIANCGASAAGRNGMFEKEPKDVAY